MSSFVHSKQTNNAANPHTGEAGTSNSFAFLFKKITEQMRQISGHWLIVPATQLL